MINIQHSALGALEQDSLARPAHLIQPFPHTASVGEDLRRDFLQAVQGIRFVDLFGAEPAQQRVVVEQKLVEPGFQAGGIGKIADPDRAAAHLILVGRADPPACGADLVLALCLFQGRIQAAVKRQDQRRVVRHHERAGRDIDPLALDGVDFLHQRPGIDHHAVADHRQFARPDHARGQ